MSLLSFIRTNYLSWSKNTPLPTHLPSPPVFQCWHEFSTSTGKWTPITTKHAKYTPQRHHTPSSDGRFALLSWNVDSSSKVPAKRIAAIISHIATPAQTADIIFFQEVSRLALHSLLDDPHIRQFWYSSEADETNWRGQSFATMTLLSKRRFTCPTGQSGDTITPRLGPVWRINYPSRFGRDALCGDVFIPLPLQPSLPGDRPGFVRVRLVNVHLDSLPIRPSKRPAQLSVVASVLRSAGRGLVAGDFNPVLGEDASLVAENQLVDAWDRLRPGEPGFTWGWDGSQPFPPGRLDKVAVFGLGVLDVEVIQPGVMEMCAEEPVAGDCLGARNRVEGLGGSSRAVMWSDHCGIRCSWALVEDVSGVMGRDEVL